jgi:hypothetical protein
MYEVHHPAFQQLRFAERRGHAQDRLVGKEHRALRHGVHVAGKTKVFQ